MREHLVANLITIAVEIAAFVILLVVFYFVIRRVIGLLARRPPLDRLAPKLQRNVKMLLKLLCLFGVLGLLGVNGWLMYEGELLHAYTLDLVRSVPREVWIGLAIGVGLVIALGVAMTFVLRRARVMIDALGVRAKGYRAMPENDAAIDRTFDALQKTVFRGGWLAFVVIGVGLLGLPNAAQASTRIALEVYLIIAVALMLWNAIDVAIISLDVVSRERADDEESLLRHYGRFASLVPLLRRSIEYGIYVGAATLVTLHIQLDTVAAWGPKIIRIIGVLFVSRVAIELGNLLLDEALINRPRLTPEARQRRLTIVPLFKTITRYAIYFGATMFILGEFGINLTPILAGAGIVAMAVGLGAQNLISDLVSGFFILFENYFLVGDYVAAGGAQGVVDQIDLRTTRIRDDAGRLHIIRNGNIDSIVNYSKDFTRAVVDVGVAYEVDLKQVFAALKAIGERLAHDMEEVLEPTQVAGVDALADSAVVVLTTTKVAPGKHRVVERELRRRIKEAFDAQGIEIPYPRRVIIQQDAAPPEDDAPPAEDAAPAA